jgi:NADPH-dependent 2,4-dienoyl-CoA reductase/sulfur reductase-like enzyme
MQKIVIVGGGAGGLGVATKLGRKLGRKNKAHVTLIDCVESHVWKPLLHEVATGALDVGIDAISYRGHALVNGYHFQQGSLIDKGYVYRLLNNRVYRGEAVHKVYLGDTSDRAAWDALVADLRAPEQPRSVTVVAPEAPERTDLTGLSDAARREFQRGWLDLKDTNDFFGLTRR